MAASSNEADRTRSLRERLEAIVSAVGGRDSITVADLADVADHVARANGLGGWPSERSRQASARRLTAGGVLAGRTRSRWEALCNELESAVDVQQRWLALLQEAGALSKPAPQDPDAIDHVPEEFEPTEVAVDRLPVDEPGVPEEPAPLPDAAAEDFDWLEEPARGPNGPREETVAALSEAPAKAGGPGSQRSTRGRIDGALRRARAWPRLAALRSALRLGLALAVALLLAELVVRMHSSSLVYVLYVGASVVLSAVGWTTLVWMLYAWRKPDSLASTRLAESEVEPAYTFSLIVPARHEEAVLQRTLERLLTGDHPEFEVLVVVGHDDQSTAAVAESIAAQYPDVVKVIVDFSWPKNKPSALNTALPYCRGGITGVFDAEDDVHPALLRRIDQCFQRTEADVVQAGVQLMNFRSSWFAVRNVLEYYFWFRSRLHFHADKGFIPLGGNTVFIRTEVLRAVGGWDPECLAEDCELGVRLSSFGARTVVAYEPELVTREETPATLRAFVRQRTRWNQGFAQTFSRRYWRSLPIGQRTLAAYTLATPFLMAFAWLMMPVAVATAILVKAPVPITLLSFLPTLPMLCVLAVETAGLGEFCRAYGERPRVRDYLRLILGLPFYQVILAFAAGRAIAREALGLRGWEKTAHLGLHLSAPEEDVSALLARRARASWRGQAASERSSAHPRRAGFAAYEPVPTLAYALATPLASLAGNGRPAWPLSIVPRAGPAREPLWVRMGLLTATGAAVLSPPIGRVGARLDLGSLARLATRLRRAVLSHLDAAVQIPLLVAVGLVGATNLLHWPGVQFDEGTYVGDAWAVAERGVLAPYTFSYGHPPLGWITIAFWTWVSGLFSNSVFSVDAGRELMLAVNLVSCSLLYVLAKRIGMSRFFAAAAVLLFALCPLSLFYHRAVLLDNPAAAWTIAAFVLALSPKRRLWTFAASGACFAASVLTKETTLVLLPALLLAAIQNAGRTRRYSLTLFASFFALIAAFYPLYATLKGELVPGRGHVSLIGYTVVQLFTRKTTGSVLDPQSAGHAIVEAWLRLDTWLLAAALVLVPIALTRRRFWPIALAFLTQIVMVLRPGYLPNMYVIGLLPFAALLVAGSCDAAVRLVRGDYQPPARSETQRAWRAAVSGVVAAYWPLARLAAWFAVAAAAAIVAFDVGPSWARADRQATSAQLDSADRAAQAWLLHNISRTKHLLVGDDYWIYLIAHGFDATPVEGGSGKGGFYSPTVVSYWPLDYDPAVKRYFHEGWRDFDYIVSTEGIRVSAPTDVPTAFAALAHSHIVASFGQGEPRVEIRKIDVPGQAQAPATVGSHATAHQPSARPAIGPARATTHPAGTSSQRPRAVPQRRAHAVPRHQPQAAPRPIARAAAHSKTRAVTHPKARTAALPKARAAAHPKTRATARPKTQAATHPKSRSAPHTKTRAIAHPRTRVVPHKRPAAAAHAKTPTVPHRNRKAAPILKRPLRHPVIMWWRRPFHLAWPW